MGSLKYLYAILLFIHGLIHFFEFARVFGNDHVTQFSKRLPAGEALVWLLTAVLFIVSASFFLRNVKSWPFIVIVTAAASQLLILTIWKETGLGTCVNIILMLVAIQAIARFRLTTKFDKEALALCRSHARNNRRANDKVDALPPIIRKWLNHSGVVGKEEIRFVRLTQKGKMRLKPKGKWMALEAVQFINPIKAAFLWKASVKIRPGIYLTGIDRFTDGRGEMQMKLFSMINVVHITPNRKMNSSSMIRYLSEIMWFPTAALHDNIHWKEVGNNKAMATCTIEGHSVSGIFLFSEAGDIVGFEAERYKETDEGAMPFKWTVRVLGYKEFNKLRIPYKGEVTWCLPGGDFTWAVFELEELEYNIRIHS